MAASSEKHFLFDEIARWLGIPGARVSDFAAAAAFTNEDSLPGVPESQLPAFLAALVASLGLTPKAWDVPAEMKVSPRPWERVLADLYAHPCAYPACLSPSQGLQLRDLILRRRPLRAIEIGCFMGVSSIWIASALEEMGGDGRLDSIDLFDPILPWAPHRYGYLGDPRAFALFAAERSGLAHRIAFHQFNSLELAGRRAPILAAPLDFAFIDGDHSHGGCSHDFFTLYPHVSLGGAILLHDTNPEFCGWDGPRRLLDRFLLPSPHCRVTEIETQPRNYGMALVEKLADDPALHPAAHAGLARFRLRSRLARSALWQSLRDTSLGRALRLLAGH